MDLTSEECAGLVDGIVRRENEQRVGRTFPPRDDAPYTVVALGHRTAAPGGRTRKTHAPSRSLVAMKPRIRIDFSRQGRQRWNCSQRRRASLRRRLHGVDQQLTGFVIQRQ